ncbi:MAG: helix-turn-helix domain-containing protein [Polyangiales bacterium]
MGAPPRRATDAEEATTVLAVGPHVALTGARTAGVRLFERSPPVHGVLLGRCELALAGRRVRSAGAVALPAGATHTVLSFGDPYACVAYLDARRYGFDDVRRLAEKWRGFVPGRDDLREALGDALAAPQRRVDGRVLRALEAIDAEGLSVAEASARAGLSESRMTHLATETLGAPPRVWRAWFKLQRAIREAALGTANLTEAAHQAGFADSAHLTRTCKQLLGVRPAEMLPRVVHVVGRVVTG